ncbi:MAG: bifunctional adenosylcobinamide kinase/adenosylcobinamide-phosphate guanylyltransferase [Oscillospiraceae bacterium]|nr:bifunctional adenosylcobinamide kinase/adenosylcobinamide-phosphate guanylyltransferase [Oscillospiraceae bacterium]
MSKITFITGGAASGKSRCAISYFASCDNVLYMFISKHIDEETKKRIEYNCEKNDVTWDIATGAEDLISMVTGRKFTILDNLGAYVNKVKSKICPNIEDMDDEVKRDIEKQAIKDISELIDFVRDANANLLIISTELGFGPTPLDKDQRYFREILGNVNQRIANISTDVYLSTSGVPFKIKGI